MKTLSKILIQASKVAVIANIVLINFLILMGNFKEVALPAVNIAVLYVGIKLQDKFNEVRNSNTIT